MKFLVVLFLCFSGAAVAQHRLRNSSAAKQELDSVNRRLDRSVVQKQAAFLQKHYAPDFVFTHSTGQVDSKETWMRYVLDSATQYLSREHDSTVVELHGPVALLTGILTVRTLTRAFGLRYVRLYAYRKKRWQLVSHRSTGEWPL